MKPKTPRTPGLFTRDTRAENAADVRRRVDALELLRKFYKDGICRESRIIYTTVFTCLHTEFDFIQNEYHCRCENCKGIILEEQVI